MYMFEGTQEILDGIELSDPTYGHLEDPRRDYTVPELHNAGKVTWLGTPGYLVAVPIENIHFMEGNSWYLGHAAALLERIRDGENHILEVPVARVERVRASDVKLSEKYEKDGELEYQMGMTRPWSRSQIGQYSAQLTDGNHRAAAAMLAGDRFIYVYVSPNYRQNVYKKDFE